MTTSSAMNAGSYPTASLYVGDLSNDITEAMLYEVFNSVGPVASIRVCRDSATRRSLGYAYVNYHAVTDAERALDTLNFTLIRNVPCRIMWSHRDPCLRRSGAGNIFVKNLDKSIDHKALYDTFSLFGNILSCKVAQDEHGNSRGFGFVHYENEEDAITATERVNKMQIGNKTVHVGPFIKRSQRKEGNNVFTNIYVRNFPGSWKDSDLVDLFSKHGKVTSAVVQKDACGRPFGYVNFEDPQSAKAAVETLHGHKVSEEDPSKTDTETTDGSTSKEEGTAPEGETEKAVKNVPGEAKEGLYVTRFQSKAERAALLKSQFNASTNDARDRRSGLNLYVKNLDEKIDDARLRELFEEFGQITSARVMTDLNGVSKGFGFVSYIMPDEATKAVTEMHLKLVENKPLYVALAERRGERAARLQQKLRPSHIRPRMPAAPQMQYGAAPPHSNMYYSHSMAQDGHPGYLPQMTRGGMPSYPQQMVGWNRVQQPGPMRGVPGQMQNNQVGIPGYPGLNPNTAPLMRGQPTTGSPMGMTMHSVGIPNEMHRRMPQNPPPSNLPSATTMHVNPIMQSAGHQHMNVRVPPNHGFGPEMADVQKQIIGEQLFPRIATLQPQLAGKITGMMLDMDTTELHRLLESETQLKDKVDEAIRVLQQAKDPSLEAVM